MPSRGSAGLGGVDLPAGEVATDKCLDRYDLLQVFRGKLKCLVFLDVLCEEFLLRPEVVEGLAVGVLILVVATHLRISHAF